MATATNDITGDTIATKTVTDAYRDNFDRIFGVKPPAEQPTKEDEPEDAQ